jgi:hypothetical protein
MPAWLITVAIAYEAGWAPEPVSRSVNIIVILPAHWLFATGSSIRVVIGMTCSLTGCISWR